MHFVTPYHPFAAIVAGIAGTLAMTMLILMAPMMGMPKMNIVGMLGTMFSKDETAAKGVGAAMHLMMGIVFALAYGLLWSFGIGHPTWKWGMIFGVVHTAFALMAMPLMLQMHPRKPEIPTGLASMLGMLLGHLVFGVVVAVVYAATGSHIG